jgi:hypothetical protein
VKNAPPGWGEEGEVGKGTKVVVVVVGGGAGFASGGAVVAEVTPVSSLGPGDRPEGINEEDDMDGWSGRRRIDSLRGWLQQHISPMLVYY